MTESLNYFDDEQVLSSFLSSDWYTIDYILTGLSKTPKPKRNITGNYSDALFTNYLHQLISQDHPKPLFTHIYNQLLSIFLTSQGHMLNLNHTNLLGHPILDTLARLGITETHTFDRASLNYVLYHMAVINAPVEMRGIVYKAFEPNNPNYYNDYLLISQLVRYEAQAYLTNM